MSGTGARAELFGAASGCGLGSMVRISFVGGELEGFEREAM